MGARTIYSKTHFFPNPNKKEPTREIIPQECEPHQLVGVYTVHLRHFQVRASLLGLRRCAVIPGWPGGQAGIFLRCGVS